jgi:hypothetical protein
MTTRDDNDDDDDDEKLVYVLCVMGTFRGLCFCQVLSVPLLSLSYGWVQWRSYSSIIMATLD